MDKLNRRRFVESMCALVATSACSRNILDRKSDTRKRPNIVVIMADDLGYGDIGCYGNRSIPTPHLDALAAGGTIFTDFHSSGAVCSPTRAGLLTGRYQQRCGVPRVITAKNHRDHGLPLGEITFAERLKKVGYQTGVFGKWHLGYHPRFNPDKQGFDHFRGYVSGNVDYFSHIDQTGIADWWDESTQITEDGYTTHLITKHATRFIKANKNRPFCLYVAHEAPHYPYQGPNDKPERTVNGKFQSRGKREDVTNAYREMVVEMDKGIGRILATLREHGLEEDTFVFFFSDNGATASGSNGVLRGHKGSLWEGGHRVPAIAYWPGKIRAGEVCHETAISLDVFPTILTLGGATLPEERTVDGVSLLSQLLANKPLEKRTLFWEYKEQKAVRKGPWKLVVTQTGQDSKTELFNLRDDLQEKKDLAKRMPEQTRRLLDELKVWEDNVDASRIRGELRERKE